MLSENLAEIQKNIEKETGKSSNQQVKLVAVSKTKAIPDIKQLYNLGVRDFGENKVQEMTDKMEHLPEDIQWHMIGHLQRNKVKYIAPYVYMIHSVDSLRLAQEIERQATKNNRIIPILIEVNMGREASKFGLMKEDVVGIIIEISKMKHVKVEGLMTSAPLVEDPTDNREIFQQMKQLSVDISSENIDNVDMNVLSMGMSNDYKIAIEEGSNLVRIGTKLFGNRNYNK